MLIIRTSKKDLACISKNKMSCLIYYIFVFLFEEEEISMQKTIKPGKFPVKMWVGTLDENSLQQVTNLSNLPFVFKHIALMPDVHSGYGMPIGAVLATKGYVLPNAVGVDIGCGVCAVKMNLHTRQFNRRLLYEMIDDIRRKVPLGFKHHDKAQDERLMPQGYNTEEMPIVKINYKAALKQLGTLGGGNHFIEMQKESDGNVWLMLHSGSRNLGLKVAEHYNRIAHKHNKAAKSAVPSSYNLAYLPLETAEAQDYLVEMNYCVDFAFANRKHLMRQVKEIINNFFPNVQYEPMINIAHNYASLEEHFGEEVLVHRKGATSARKAEKGIIPGSQGTNSYIVEGLGHPDSFMSCSHGAGRLMSRTKAIKNLNLREEVEKLSKKGIIHSITKKKDLDEAPSAYKNISEVMRLQKDLVKVINELSPMAVVKA